MRILLLIALVAGCKGDTEGQQPGDCTDDADNDGDGLFDCDDDGCAGSDSCDAVDTDADADTDADSDSDTDSDTDADTDSDTDADTDSDTDSDTDADVTAERWSGHDRIPDGGYELKGDKYLDRVGMRVAVGDFDGDGDDDVATGAPHADGGGEDAGAVYVVTDEITGDVNLWEVPSVWESGDAGSAAGVTLASGDIDGDGRDDLLVGAPGRLPDNGCYGGIGVVYLLTDPTAGGDLASATVFTPASTDFCFGSDLAIGDITGDGQLDIVIGARGSEAYAYDGGAAYVFDDPLSGGSVSAASTSIYGTGGSTGQFGYLGSSLDIVGDLDGDGADDLAISAPRYFTASVGYTGTVLVFFGPPSSALLPDDADFRLNGHYGDTGLGSGSGTISGAGDVDADGLGDLLVSGFAETSVGDGSRYQGGVYLVGGAQLTKDIDTFFAEWKVQGSDNESLGISTTGAGDLDGDGFDDVLIGGTGNDDYASFAGASRLWYGPLTGTGDTATADAGWYGVAVQDFLGADQGVGDVTGDGVVDIVIGASASEGGAAYSGAVFVMPGTAL